MSVVFSKFQNSEDQSPLDEFETLIAQGAYHLALPLCRVLSNSQAKNMELARKLGQIKQRQTALEEQARLLTNGLVQFAATSGMANHGMVTPQPFDAAKRARSAYATTQQLEMDGRAIASGPLKS